MELNKKLTPEDNKTIELIAEKIKQADRLLFEAKQEFYLRFPDDEPNVEQRHEDNKTIVKIDERVKILEGIMEKVLERIVNNPIFDKPSPAKDEVEYVIFFKSEIPKYPKNSVWLWSDLVKAGFKNFAGTFFCYEYKLNPSTLSAYQAQQQVECVKYKTSIVANHSKYEVRVFGFETQEEAIKIEKIIQNTLK